MRLSPAASGCISRRRRATRPRLLVVGDLVLDIVVAANREVESGTDVSGTISFRAGGSAANTARTFAALGGDASFVGAVGTDLWARRLVSALRADGVRVRAVPVTQPTARLVALLAPGGERSFVTQRGAADMLSAAAVQRSWLSRLDAVHLPAYSLLREPLAGAAGHAAQSVRAAGGLVSVDLASRRPLLEAGPRQARERIAVVSPDVLFANADEARALTAAGQQRRLLDLAPLVVIKEGHAGCRVMWRTARTPDVLEIQVATTRAATSDTTGAGDAFDAGFLHRLLLTGRATDGGRRAAELRRAAVAGHSAAAKLLTRPRSELVL